MLKDEMPFTGILSQVLATHSAIQPVSLVFFTPQAPARQDQIFTLQRLTPGTLSLVTLQGNAVTMPPNGRFIFVILMTDPTQIRCARGHDPLNEYMSSGAVDAVEGHTSLSGGSRCSMRVICSSTMVFWSAGVTTAVTISPRRKPDEQTFCRTFSCCCQSIFSSLSASGAPALHLHDLWARV